MSNEVDKIVPDTDQPVPKQKPSINKYGVEQRQGEPAVLKHEIFRSRDPFDVAENTLIARVFKLRPETSKHFANLDYGKMWKKAVELNVKYPSQLITPEFNVVPYKEQITNYDILNLRDCNSGNYNRSTVLSPVPWEYAWKLIQSCVFVRLACNFKGIEWSDVRSWFNKQDRAHKLAMLDGMFSPEHITSTDWFFLHIRRSLINTICPDMLDANQFLSEDWIKNCDSTNPKNAIRSKNDGNGLNYRDANIKASLIMDCSQSTVNTVGRVSWNGTATVNFETIHGNISCNNVSSIERSLNDSNGLVKWLDRHVPRKFWTVNKDLASYNQGSSYAKWSV